MMDRGYTGFVSGLLFPLHERLKGHTSVAVRRSLERSQWWSDAQLESLQLERLRKLLIEAGRNVPYYRNLFARVGFDPHAVRRLADLQRLPLLSKADVRADVDAFKNAEASDLKRFNTGGSSGEPLVFFVGKERISHDVAAKWRATRWWGVDIGDREAVVWGSPIELQAQDRLRAWRDRLLRTRLLPAFEMSEQGLDRFVAAIRRQRPRMLFGYPSALTRLACHAELRGRAINDLGIAVAFVTGERLYPDQRATLERVFGCRVANGYGGRDAGFIAHECPEGSLHVAAEDVIVELLASDGTPVPAGHSGEVVVTHLCTGDFPFIRYRTGDIATLARSKCVCGRGLPVLEELDGRATDFVTAADGTVMHGLALIYVVRDLPGVRAFRIVQHDLHRTAVQVVAGPEFDDGHATAIRRGFRRRLGERVHVDVERVASIVQERSGKYRYVISHVADRPAQPSAVERPTSHA